MRKFILTIFILSFINNISAQEYCGTTATNSQIRYMEEIQDKTSLNARAMMSDVSVPIKFFIIRRADGSGGLSENRISSLINEVNNVYGISGISFFRLGGISIIESDEYYNLDASNESTLASSRDVNGAINVYISGTLTSSGSNLCGYTYFPPSADRIFLNMSCADNEYGTFAHELGHYFTLYHTHGKTNTGTTDELVQRVNCDRLGDNLCDTPADPNLSGQVSGCAYTGNARDANGDYYTPDVSNLMSYAPNNCRLDFSPGQYDRMVNGLQQGRSYLNLQYDNFSARFSVNQRKGCAPFVVNFEDITQGGRTRTWYFEGGDIASSTSSNPEVTYEIPGRYDVRIVAVNDNGDESEFILRDFIVIDDVYKDVVPEATYQNFETNTFPLNWNVNNADGLLTFEITEDASYNGESYSIRLDNYNYNIPNKELDELILPNYNIEEAKKLDFRFKYAYTYLNSSSEENTIAAYDTIAFGYQLDCENRFFELFRRGGEELSTALPTTDFFIPANESQWKELEFSILKQDIQSFENSRVIKPIIRNYCRNGNALYLDDFEIVPDYSLDSIENFRISNFVEEAIELRWFNPAINETGLVIERKVGNGDYIVLDTIPKNATTFIDENLPSEASNWSYRIKNQNSFEESSYSREVTADRTVLSSRDSFNLNLNIYPNPISNREFKIDNADNIPLQKIEVFNKFGKKIQVFDTVDNQDSFHLNDFNSGIYFVKVYSIFNTFKTTKILIQN